VSGYTQDAPRFGLVILHQQFALLAIAYDWLSPELALLLHSDIPLTVCLTPGLPSSDVTDHVPASDWLPDVRVIAYTTFDNSPDLLFHLLSQSSWHSFIACAPDIAPPQTIAANADIINFECFIILSPFVRRFLVIYGKNHQHKLVAGGSKQSKRIVGLIWLAPLFATPPAQAGGYLMSASTLFERFRYPNAGNPPASNGFYIIKILNATEKL
jgi:hypothetical protein